MFSAPAPHDVVDVAQVLLLPGDGTLQGHGSAATRIKGSRAVGRELGESKPPCSEIGLWRPIDDAAFQPGVNPGMKSIASINLGFGESVA